MRPSGPAYPFAALVELRRHRVDEARAELAGARGEARRAERRAADAEGALRDAVGRRLTGERELGWAGAADAELRARWLARLREGERELGAEAARLREEAARAAAREDRRRAHLLEAERQLRTIERHREIWEADRRRAIRLAEELGMEEVTAQRRT